MASASVGTLHVGLVASTKAFQKGFARAAKTLRKFADSAKQYAKYAALAVAGGLALMVKKTLVSVDELGKLSDRLGIATEDLTALNHAANLAGISAETMRKSMERMERRIGLFVTGSGAAAKALERFGFSQKELANLDTGEQFRLIAEKISKLPTLAERSAAAFEIFGNQGQQLLPILETGAAGLDAFSAEASRLGLTFSRVDAAQIEAANDSVTRLKAAFTGVAQQITIRVAPYITALAESVANWAASSGAATSGVAAGFSFVAKAAGLVMNGIHTLRVGFGWLQKTATAVLAAIVARIRDLMEFARRNLAKIGIEIGRGWEGIADSISRSAAQQQKAFNNLLSQPLPSEKIDKWVKDLNDRSRQKAEEIAQAAVARVAPPTALTQGINNFVDRFGKGLAAAKSIGSGITAGLGPAKKPAAAATGPKAARPERAAVAEAGTAEAWKAIRETNQKLPEEQLKVSRDQVKVTWEAVKGINHIGQLLGKAAAKVVSVPS